MASPSSGSLDRCTVDLSKGVESLIGSYFEAAACGITGARAAQEDVHALMSFSVAPFTAAELLAFEKDKQQHDNNNNSKLSGPTTTTVAGSPVKTVFTTSSAAMIRKQANQASSHASAPGSVASAIAKHSNNNSNNLEQHQTSNNNNNDSNNSGKIVEEKSPFAPAGSLVSSINKTYSCFGVFDGHGSQDCSKYMARELPLTVQTTLRKYATDLLQQKKRLSTTPTSSPTTAPTESSATPVLMMMDTKESRAQLEDRITQTFHAIDKRFLLEELADDPGDYQQSTFGSTCVFVVVEPVSQKNNTTANDNNTNNNNVSGNTLAVPTSSTSSSSTSSSPSKSPGRGLGSTFSGSSMPPVPGAPIVARAMICNLGDSRCMVLRNGRIVFRTIDHKPDTPKERERIEKCKNPLCKDDIPGNNTLSSGGFLSSHYYVSSESPCRINGIIAVARSFGDKPFKPYCDPAKDPVSSTPKIDFVDLYKNDVLLLGCDGLFDGEMFAEGQLVSHIAERVGQLAARYDYQHWGAPRNRSASDPPVSIPYATLATTCAELCHKAIGGGSTDNISSMLVRLAEDHLLHPGGGGRLTRRRSSGQAQLLAGVNGTAAGASSPQPLAPKLGLGAQRKRSQTTVGKTPEPMSSAAAAAVALIQQNNANNNNINSNHNNNLLGAPDLYNVDGSRRTSLSTSNSNSNNLAPGVKKRRASSVLANHPSQPRPLNNNSNNANNSDNIVQFEGTLPGLQETQKISGEGTGLAKLAPSSLLEGNHNNSNRPARHQRSHSSQNMYPVNNNNNNIHASSAIQSNNNNSNAFQHQRSGVRKSIFGLLGEDPIFLIGKLRTKFVAGPLPECNESWNKFLAMAHHHDTDANVAAEKRLRFLRAAHDETQSQKRLQSLNPQASSNKNSNGNDPSSLQQQGSMSGAEYTNRGGGLGGGFGLVVTTSMNCGPLVDGAGSGRGGGGAASAFGMASAASGAPLDPALTGTQYIQANTSCVQQYAAHLVASGDYTEEEIALLTCQQSPADLALEYKKMVTILKAQRKQDEKELGTFSITVGGGGGALNQKSSGKNKQEDVVLLLDGNKNNGDQDDDDDDDDDDIQKNLPSNEEWISMYRRFVEKTTAKASKDIFKAGCGEGRGFGDSFNSMNGLKSSDNNSSNPLNNNNNNNSSKRNNNNITSPTGGDPQSKLENDKNNILLLVTQQLINDNDDYDNDDFEEGEEFYDDDDGGEDNLDGCYRASGGVSGSSAHRAQDDDDDDDKFEDDDDDEDNDDEDALAGTINALRKR